eukprot:2002314-Pleurochrysis_carterae.AAC.1
MKNIQSRERGKTKERGRGKERKKEQERKKLIRRKRRGIKENRNKKYLTQVLNKVKKGGGSVKLERLSILIRTIS